MSRCSRITGSAAISAAALVTLLGGCGRFGFEYLTGDGGPGPVADGGGKATDSDAAAGAIDSGTAAGAIDSGTATGPDAGTSTTTDGGTTVSADGGAAAVCVQANGLTWCYDPNQCGQPCNSVCAAMGLTPLADDTVWFEAQNTAAECQAISDAFGVTTPVVIANYRYACLEDESGTHSVGGGLLAPLYCSTVSTCPSKLRNTLDQHNPCGASSTRSICPCE